MPAPKIPSLCIVLPCYNEEEVLPSTHSVLLPFLERLVEQKLIAQSSRICYVNDGSHDATWPLIKSFAEDSAYCTGISLASNFGHQHALLAGMMELKDQFDCLVTLDADLQDDHQLISEMLAAYKQGAKVVYGIRKSREKDSAFKKLSALAFYKLMAAMKVDTVHNHADFRLMDRQVLLALSQYREVNLYLRGLFPLMGFRSAKVYYDRKERSAGETKYPLSKMLSFAWNGITSFSTYPVRLVLNLGILTFIGSLLLAAWVFWTHLTGRSIPGWSSTTLPLFIFGGIQMISLGLIGEYVGKIYAESKSRPRYLIEERTNLADTAEAAIR